MAATEAGASCRTPIGARALAAGDELLAQHFRDDIAMFAFKVSPQPDKAFMHDEAIEYLKHLQLQVQVRNADACLDDVEINLLMHLVSLTQTANINIRVVLVVSGLTDSY